MALTAVSGAFGPGAVSPSTNEPPGAPPYRPMAVAGAVSVVLHVAVFGLHLPFGGVASTGPSTPVAAISVRTIESPQTAQAREVPPAPEPARPQSPVVPLPETPAPAFPAAAVAPIPALSPVPSAAPPVPRVMTTPAPSALAAAPAPVSVPPAAAMPAGMASPAITPQPAPTLRDAAFDPAGYASPLGLNPPPRPLGPVDPALPDAAGGRGGVVTIRVYVNERGGVDRVEVVSSTPPGLFDASAIAAFGSVPYSPGLLGGVPVRSYTQFEVSYGSAAGGGEAAIRTY